MAHISKFKMSQVCGLLEHNGRTDGQRQHVHKNIDIDPSRTRDNYELCHGSETPFSRFKNRIEQLHVLKRDDVNVLDSIIVTLPPEVKFYEQRKFFESVYNFACRDYGEKNIVNATVHMDETTPHIHIGFIPVVDGKLRNGTPVQKVNHSGLINKRYLASLHSRLSAAVEHDLGYKVSIENGATADGNKTIKQLKQEQFQWQIFAEAENDTVRRSLDSRKSEIIAAEAEIKAAKAELETIKGETLADQKAAKKALSDARRQADLIIKDAITQKIAAEDEIRAAKAELETAKGKTLADQRAAEKALSDALVLKNNLEKMGIVAQEQLAALVLTHETALYELQNAEMEGIFYEFER